LCNSWRFQHLKYSNDRRNTLNIEFVVWLYSTYQDKKKGDFRKRPNKPFKSVKFQFEDIRF
jgi:hypothetical protein